MTDTITLPRSVAEHDRSPDLVPAVPCARWRSRLHRAGRHHLSHEQQAMNTLPFDSHRCAPLRPDAHCRQCLRFDRLPGQTWGERTPVAVGRSGSQDNGCAYIPIRSKE